MIDIKTLALKHGANLFDDLYPDTTSVAFNDMVRFQAFADEYLALRSSEPVGYVVSRFSEGMHEKDEYFTTKESAYENARWGFNETKITPVYLANPLNQQLLTERNELIADIETFVKVSSEQAIPSGWIDTGYLLEQLDAYGLSVDHLQMPMSTKLFVSAAPTAPIESDK
jgi:hypothetical protein